jgi:hypothetical protein
MNRWYRTACIMAVSAMMLAQIGTAHYQASETGSAPYQPAVPAASTVNTYGYYPEYRGASTAAGSALNGMANAISAMGNYNLSTSAAAVNMTQARRNNIENQQIYTDAYFQMRAANRSFRAAEAGPRPTAEQLARLARDGAPKPLSPGDLDSISGRINWPTALQQETFAANRAELEKLSAAQAMHGTLTAAEQMAARKMIESMFADLRSQVSEIPPQEYVASRNFLRSLIYTTTQSQL